MRRHAATVVAAVAAVAVASGGQRPSQQGIRCGPKLAAAEAAENLHGPAAAAAQRRQRLQLITCEVHFDLSVNRRPKTISGALRPVAQALASV